MGQPEQKISNHRIVNGVSDWITGADLVRSNNFFHIVLRELKEDSEYKEPIIEGVRTGLESTFDGGIKAAFSKKDWFTSRFSHILNQLVDHPELIPALNIPDFASLTEAVLDGSIRDVDIDRLKSFAKIDSDLAILLKVGVKGYMNAEVNYQVEMDPQADNSDYRDPTENEIKERRQAVSIHMVGKFFDVPEVLELVETDDLTPKVTEDLTPDDPRYISAHNLTVVAKSLEHAPQFKSAITAEQITFATDHLFAQGDHKAARELYENVKHIPEFEAAFMEECSDVISLGKNITVAFNTSAKGGADKPQMTIFVGTEKFNSFADLQASDDHKDSLSVMNVAWTLELLAQNQDAVVNDSVILRTSNNTEALARIAQAQLDNAFKPAPA